MMRTTRIDCAVVCLPVLMFRSCLLCRTSKGGQNDSHASPEITGDKVEEIKTN
jgi:hypothetical protein